MANFVTSYDYSQTVFGDGAHANQQFYIGANKYNRFVLPSGEVRYYMNDEIISANVYYRDTKQNNPLGTLTILSPLVPTTMTFATEEETPFSGQTVSAIGSAYPQTSSLSVMDKFNNFMGNLLHTTPSGGFDIGTTPSGGADFSQINADLGMFLHTTPSGGFSAENMQTDLTNISDTVGETVGGLASGVGSAVGGLTSGFLAGLNLQTIALLIGVGYIFLKVK